MGIFRTIKKKKNKNYLKQIYKTNPETNDFIIEVSLDSYNEVFNGWDPSPIKRRDLEPDMLSFIQECSRDIPLKYGVELRFYLPLNRMDQEKENLTIIGIENNFKFIQLNTKRRINSNYRNIVKYIMMSFSFLIVAYIFKKNKELTMILNIMIEGMFIGGWVFLWEAFTLIFFTGQDLHSGYKRIYRFTNAPIRFEYVA